MTATIQAPQATSKLTSADRKFFRGTAAEVHPWMTTEQILDAINSNFRVTRHSAQVGGRSYEDCQLWLRDDTNDLLGFFGHRRQVIQPATFIEYFRAFTEASDKQLTLDVVGSLDKGKTFYMASKLTSYDHLLDRNIGDGRYGIGGGLDISRRGSSLYIPSEERTTHWLVVTEYFSESLRPKAIIFSDELVCSNGLSRTVTDQSVKLAHTAGGLSYENVSMVLNQALRQSRAYDVMKNRFIETPITLTQARNAIRTFFRDEDAKSNTVKKLELIYSYDLIGGDRDTRSANLWRLASAVTQYTSHERLGKGDGAHGRALRSQLEGSRARTGQRFMEFLEQQFLPQDERVLTAA